jgi:hypothetical protein
VKARSLESGLFISSLDAARYVEAVPRAQQAKRRFDYLWANSWANRRGLATTSSDWAWMTTSFQAILRHQSIPTTQSSYVKMVSPDVTAAMKQLEASILCAAESRLIVGKLLKIWSRRSDLNR